MTIEIWFPPAMVALFAWGVTAFLPKIVLRHLSPLHMIVYSSVFFFAGVAVVQLFFGMPEFQPVSVLYAMVTGACGSCGQILYLNALRRGPLTYVSLISSLYPLVATLLAAVVLHDHISLRQGAGVALGLCSIITLVRAHHDG